MWTVPPVPPTAPPPETPIWAGCWLALSLTYPLFGYQPDPLGAWQWMAWHIFAVWYVLARCGMLAQGYSGSLVLLDGLAGVFRLPFGNFFLRVRTVFSALKPACMAASKPVRRCACWLRRH